MIYFYECNLVTLVPHKEMVIPFINKIIVSSIHLLEEGLSLYDYSNKRPQNYIRSIFAFFGDHMGQIELEGIIGPSKKLF